MHAHSCSHLHTLHALQTSVLILGGQAVAVVIDAWKVRNNVAEEVEGNTWRRRWWRWRKTRVCTLFCLSREQYLTLYNFYIITISCIALFRS